MFSEVYKRYVLGALTLVYALNYLDRGLMLLLLQPIKDDLHLSDTQLGLLTGLAFGLFYATLGLPMARWADRGNRPTITALAIAVWGATVMSCVFVANFIQLVLARVAAAIGEAGCMPATYSLLGDYFPAPPERARAMSIYWLASPLAALASFIFGGWLNDHYGWRTAFLVMGLPALPVALLVKATISEPRTRAVVSDPPNRPLPKMRDVLGVLWRQRSCRHLSIVIVLLFTMWQGLGPWFAAFMIRSHGMGTTALGVWLGLIFGIGGISGTLLGGIVASRWFANDERGQMRFSAWMTALLVPCIVVFLLVPRKEEALIALVPLIVVGNVFLGPSFALLQRLVADEMRATTLAVVMLFANLIGMGVGPQLVGILSDLLRSSLGSNSLRVAMLSMSLAALWAAFEFRLIGGTIREDLAASTEDLAASRHYREK
jgi:predicted MFS family arabinose efflux permease